jgi:hypothetical protein
VGYDTTCGTGGTSGVLRYTFRVPLLTSYSWVLNMYWGKATENTVYEHWMRCDDGTLRRLLSRIASPPADGSKAACKPPSDKRIMCAILQGAGGNIEVTRFFVAHMTAPGEELCTRDVVALMVATRYVSATRYGDADAQSKASIALIYCDLSERTYCADDLLGWQV